MGPPSPEDVRAQLDRIIRSRSFRGAKLQTILRFLIEEWIRDGGKKLTAAYIGVSTGGEQLTFEPDSDKWGYPRTRANLAHIRNRLKSYHETQGYRDPIIIRLNPGSYAPAVSRNPVSAAQDEIDPPTAVLILRAKAAIDTRTLKGALRALRYYEQIPATGDNARALANIAFIPMAIAPIIPHAPMAIRASLDTLITRIKRSGTEPWESIFAEACAEACYRHKWQAALHLFELANAASRDESKYLWWYTALLASQGRIEEAIGILDVAVRHFSRNSIAARTDLALLQIMAGRFSEAEEILFGSLDFTAKDNPLLLLHLTIFYEAQDRLDEATMPLLPVLQAEPAAGADGSVQAYLGQRDLTNLLGGMAILIAGRLGQTAVASAMVDVLLDCKARNPATSSVEVALGLIGAQRFDEAVTWLHKAAFEESDPWSMWFHIFPPLRHLKHHRGFKAFLKALKLHAPR